MSEMGGSTASFEQPLTAEYRFVLCEHTSANAEQIIAALQDCDVIALEAPGCLDEDERTRLGDKYTAYVSSAATADQVNVVDDEFAADIAFFQEKGLSILKDQKLLDKSLLGSFAGTDKKIVLIDMNANHPEYMKTGDFPWSPSIKNVFMSASKVSVASMALRTAVEKTAVFTTARENIMARQLEKLGQEHPKAKIGVMLGAVHTGVQHTIAKKAPTSRNFIVSHGDAELGIRAHYDPISKSIRDLHFNTRETIDEAAMNRLTLQQYYSEYNGSSHPAVAEMSNAYVDEVLLEIDDINARESEFEHTLFRQWAVSGVLYQAAGWISTIEDKPIPGVVNDEWQPSP